MCQQTISPPIKRSEQCKADKGAAVFVYAGLRCSAHGWAVQMHTFIYNPPNFPVIAFLVLTQTEASDSIVFPPSWRDERVFPGWPLCVKDDRLTAPSPLTIHSEGPSETGITGRERGEREWRERSSCDSPTRNTPESTNRGRGTSASEAGQRTNASTAGTI